MQVRSQDNDLGVATELARVTVRTQTEGERDRETTAGTDFAAMYPL